MAGWADVVDLFVPAGVSKSPAGLGDPKVAAMTSIDIEPVVSVIGPHGQAVVTEAE